MSGPENLVHHLFEGLLLRLRHIIRQYVNSRALKVPRNVYPVLHLFFDHRSHRPYRRVFTRVGSKSFVIGRTNFSVRLLILVVGLTSIIPLDVHRFSLLFRRALGAANSQLTARPDVVQVRDSSEHAQFADRQIDMANEREMISSRPAIARNNEAVAAGMLQGFGINGAGLMETQPPLVFARRELFMVSKLSAG